MTPLPSLTKIDEVRDYVSGVLASFDGDAADDDFQRGYQAAFEELRREMGFEPDGGKS